MPPKPPRVVPPLDVRDVIVLEVEFVLEELRFERPLGLPLCHAPKIGRPRWKRQRLRLLQD